MARGRHLPMALLLLMMMVTPSSAQTLRPSDQLPVTARTHTFASYLGDPIITPLVPVFVSTVRKLRTYADVSFFFGIPLNKRADEL
jgi:hypothetical protein